VLSEVNPDLHTSSPVFLLSNFFLGKGGVVCMGIGIRRKAGLDGLFAVAFGLVESKAQVAASLFY